MGLSLDIKITTIYYYVKDTFKSDKGIINVFDLTTDYNNVGVHAKRCRVAYLDELIVMSTSNGLVFKGLLCVYEGYYIWDSINKIYLPVDVNSGII